MLAWGGPCRPRDELGVGADRLGHPRSAGEPLQVAHEAIAPQLVEAVRCVTMLRDFRAAVCSFAGRMCGQVEPFLLLDRRNPFSLTSRRFWRSKRGLSEDFPTNPRRIPGLIANS